MNDKKYLYGHGILKNSRELYLPGKDRIMNITGLSKCQDICGNNVIYALELTGEDSGIMLEVDDVPSEYACELSGGDFLSMIQVPDGTCVLSIRMEDIQIAGKKISGYAGDVQVDLLLEEELLEEESSLFAGSEIICFSMYRPYMDKVNRVIHGACVKIAGYC